MTTASGSLRARRARAPRPSRRQRRSLAHAGGGVGIALVLVVAARHLGGRQVARRRPVAAARHDRRRSQIDYEHVPPLTWRIADDLSLPHVWDIARAFVDPGPARRRAARRRPRRPGRVHLRRGAGRVRARRRSSGSALGVLFVHSRLAERAFVPYVVASPDGADPGHRAARRRGAQGRLAVGHGGRDVPDVLPGHDRVDARPAGRSTRARSSCSGRTPRRAARSSGSSGCRRRCRTCSPGFRVAAAASIIGAIIGEQTAGVASGLGSAIINYNQYYISAPERLWATIVMCTLVGFVFVGIVNLAERARSRAAATGQWRGCCDVRTDSPQPRRGPVAAPVVRRGRRRRQGLRDRRRRGRPRSSRST